MQIYLLTYLTVTLILRQDVRVGVGTYESSWCQRELLSLQPAAAVISECECVRVVLLPVVVLFISTTPSGWLPRRKLHNTNERREEHPTADKLSETMTLISSRSAAPTSMTLIPL